MARPIKHPRRVLLLMGVYYSEIHEGIIHYAQEAGWELNNLYNRLGSPPVWWRGEGIIGLITHLRDYQALQHFPKLPLVDISKGWITNALPARCRTSGKSIPRVLYDNAGIARLAADHFIVRGYKHIAVLNSGNYWMEVEQMEELRRVTTDAHVTLHEIPYYKHFSGHGAHLASNAQAAFLWLAQALKSLPKPLGLFAGGDADSLRLLSACQYASLKVPDDVAILGYGNETLLCENSTPTLSSVDVNLFSQGYEAARLLDRLIDGAPPPPHPIIIPPKGVVTRMSTDIMKVPHPNVARALQYIWEHFKEPLQVRDVVTVSGLSRRHMEATFVRTLHRSISREIMNRRIDHAQHLLTTTPLKVQEIAEKSGFSSLAHFARAFKRVTGKRPSQVRGQKSGVRDQPPPKNACLTR